MCKATWLLSVREWSARGLAFVGCVLGRIVARSARHRLFLVYCVANVVLQALSCARHNVLGQQLLLLQSGGKVLQCASAKLLLLMRPRVCLRCYFGSPRRQCPE